MKKILFPLLFPFLVMTTSCEELEDIFGQTGDDSLTETEVISGLKSALSVGTDAAVANLSASNGYYGNELYKILLPEEANQAITYLSTIPGGTEMVNDVILGINRAAEDAAKEAGPIFLDAITDMTIADGWNILNGDNHAATTYLKTSTNSALFALYSPKIGTSLNADLGLGFTANTAWSNLTTAWNKVANSMVGQLAGYKPISTNLGQYLTQKALDGMYLKISEEEEKIRLDPAARVNDILQKVFGSVD